LRGFLWCEDAEPPRETAFVTRTMNTRSGRVHATDSDQGFLVRNPGSCDSLVSGVCLRRRAREITTLGGGAHGEVQAAVLRAR
jgi:hypothetical protein